MANYNCFKKDRKGQVFPASYTSRYNHIYSFDEVKDIAYLCGTMASTTTPAFPVGQAGNGMRPVEEQINEKIAKIVADQEGPQVPKAYDFDDITEDQAEDLDISSSQIAGLITTMVDAAHGHDGVSRLLDPPHTNKQVFECYGVTTRGEVAHQWKVIKVNAQVTLVIKNCTRKNDHVKHKPQTFLTAVFNIRDDASWEFKEATLYGRTQRGLRLLAVEIILRQFLMVEIAVINEVSDRIGYSYGEMTADDQNFQYETDDSEDQDENEDEDEYNNEDDNETGSVSEENSDADSEMTMVDL